MGVRCRAIEAGARAWQASGCWCGGAATSGGARRVHCLATVAIATLWRPRLDISRVARALHFAPVSFALSYVRRVRVSPPGCFHHVVLVVGAGRRGPGAARATLGADVWRKDVVARNTTMNRGINVWRSKHTPVARARHNRTRAGRPIRHSHAEPVSRQRLPVSSIVRQREHPPCITAERRFVRFSLVVGYSGSRPYAVGQPPFSVAFCSLLKGYDPTRAERLCARLCGGRQHPNGQPGAAEEM